MALFKIKNSNVTKLSTIDLEKEKNIQTLFEQNLLTILNVNFLATEYSTSFGGRIDTLGIDKSGSPVIIEYKRNQNDNVINQGLSYLRWLLDHKADFEILCRNNKIDIEIDWTSPRVICVAESYNKFQLDTVEILPIKIELLKYRIYVDVVIQKNAIKAFLNVPSGKLNDSFDIARDLTKPKVIGHWGNGDYDVLIKNKDELLKLFELIRQSYNYNK